MTIYWFLLGYMLSSIIHRIDTKMYDTIQFPIFVFVCVVFVLILSDPKDRG